jgi:hypothetical protein
VTQVVIESRSPEGAGLVEINRPEARNDLNPEGREMPASALPFSAWTAM